MNNMSGSFSWMKRSCLILAWALLLGLWPGIIAPASAQSSALFGKLPNYCKIFSGRRTAIYIDDSVVDPNERGWRESLRAALTFIPGERVEIIRFSANGNAETVFQSCVPGSDEDGATFSQKLGFSKGEVLEHKMLFNQALLGAFDKIVAQGKRPSINSASSTPITKNIVRVLDADASRFKSSGDMPRIIIFSDMMQFGSDFPQISSEAELQTRLKATARNYSQSFRWAEIYILRAPPNANVKEASLSMMEKFWRLWFMQRDAHVQSFGTSMPLPKYEKLRYAELLGAVIHEQSHLMAKVRVLLSEPGEEIVNGWFSIENYGALPISGALHLGKTMSLEARLRNGLPHLTSTDKRLLPEDGSLTAGGTAGDVMRGTLQAARPLPTLAGSTVNAYEVGFVKLK